MCLCVRSVDTRGESLNGPAKQEASSQLMSVCFLVRAPLRAFYDAVRDAALVFDAAPLCRGVCVCVCNNAYGSKKGTCVSGLPVMFLNVWIHTQGLFGTRLCWPHLRLPWPAECCMAPGHLMHNPLAQTCRRTIYTYCIGTCAHLH